MKGNQKTMATLSDFEIWSKNLYLFFRGVDHSDYMSDTANLSAEDINVKGCDFLNDKSLLRERIPNEWLLDEFGTIHNGEIHPFDNNVLGFINKVLNGRSVIKNVSESSGDGIVFSEQMTEEKFEELILRSYNEKLLVSEWAIQHDYSKKVWHKSSNSLRFLVYSPNNEPSKITACVHKWGTNNSGHMDNWNKGGLSTTVINGVLFDTMEDFTTIDQRGGNGSSREPKYPGVPNRFSYHIESGAKIAGTHLPYWQECVEMVLNASEILRDDLPYIGWDVIITENGPKIIEGNPWPGIQLIQVHYPLFGDIRFKEFMLSHNVKGI